MSADDLTATTMSTIASTNATIAQVNAELAQETADRAVCMVQMRGYQNDTATVEAARAYASGIRLVYGTGERLLPHNILVALKLLVVICIVSTILSGWRFYRKDREVVMGVLGALLGLMVSMCVFGLGGLAVWFLFS